MALVPRLKLEQIMYRSYKKFQDDAFLNDLRELDLQPRENNPDNFYCRLTNSFWSLVDIHAPLKTIILRGNIMNKDLIKTIYLRSNLKEKYNEFCTKECELKYKKELIKCVSLREKAIFGI